MHLVCPHCQNPIEIVNVSRGEEILCPSCGSTFNVAPGTLQQSTLTHDWTSHHFDRFELCEVLGTGAFGTVWKAHDPRLDRTVALKIPRAGNLGGAAERDRFLREARAAGQLRHESIVAVYEVGEHEGQPYIVSDFVEGIDLAHWLSANRPTFREAATWIAGVADALHYAHDRGVIHRDIKPSNLILDGDGRLHVMDFGLAKRDAGEISMTHDGQILGTPAYMAPEQIQKAHNVDGRADVYSLWVILYRLLTGETPFRGTARMLLHQVLHDEPRPPRKLNEHIPRDLETICLKAMVKEPERRYATAKDLAEDLRNFLEDKPIQARPVGSFEKIWRWANRNRTVAALLAALAVVFMAGFTGVVLALIRSEHYRGVADEKRLEAVGQSQVAEARCKDAKKAEQLAEEQGKQAEANFDRAIAAVDDFLTKVADEKLFDTPGLAPLRRDLLTSALAFYQRFLKERKGDLRLEPCIAAAYLRVAKINDTLGMSKESQGAEQLAQETYERLRIAVPRDRTLRAGLAETLGWRGKHLEAIALWEALVQEEPGSIGFRRSLAMVYNRHGLSQEEVGKHAEALLTYQKSLAFLEAIAREQPQDPRALDQLAYPYNDIGVILGRLGRNEEALIQYQRGAELSRRAAANQPASYVIRQSLGLELSNVTGTLFRMGRKEESLKAYQEVVEVRQRLARDFGFIPSVQRDLLQSRQSLARLYLELGRKEEAWRHLRTIRDHLSSLPQATVEELYTLACATSVCGEIDQEAIAKHAPDPELATESRRNIAIALKSLSDAVEQGFLDLHRLRNDPDLATIRNRPEFQSLLVRVEQLRKADELGAQAKKLAGGEQLAGSDRLRVDREAQAARRDALAAALGSPARQRDAAISLHSVGILQTELGQFDEAAQSLAEALKLRQALTQHPPKSTTAKAELGSTHIALGQLAWKRGRLGEAEASWATGFDLIEQALRENPSSASLRHNLASYELQIADLEWTVLLIDRAAARYERAFAVEPPAEAHAWYRRALLLLARGDRAGYLAHCRASLKRFENSSNSFEGAQVAWSWAYGPDQGELSPDRMVALADRHRSNAAPRDVAAIQFCALVHYRAGRDQDAVRLARVALDVEPKAGPAGLVLALAHHRLGSTTEARYWLAQADRSWDQEVRQTLERPLTATRLYPWSWSEQLILYDEAKRQIEGTAYRGDAWTPPIAAREALILYDPVFPANPFAP